MRRSAPMVVICGAIVGAAGCGAGGKPPPRTTASVRPQTAPATHPFTGGTTGLGNPVLAVKVDNTQPAHPQAGLRAADVVYVEQVEGGLTRIMAVFSSRLPNQVGPVRSGRISDLHILAQYDKPAFAYSGVQSKLKPYVARAPLVDVSAERAEAAYQRNGGRSAPYDLMVSPWKLLAQATAAGAAKDIGFRFGPAPAEGKDTSSFSVRYPAASFDFRWSAKERRWRVWQDGKADRAAEGGRLGGETVVVQYARTTRSRFHDFLGNYTPLIHTTGTGTAVVLRDGKSYDARWSRPTEADGTTFTTASGQPLPFAPGQVWVVLVKPGKPEIP